MLKVVLAAILVLSFAAVAAIADEELTPLAANGDWAAFEHRESMEDPPDFCVAAQTTGHFLLRADNNDIEVRYMDDSWSLPAKVMGTLDIAVNGNNYPLPITNNTNDMVIATISQDQLAQIVGDMNKSASLTVKAGSGPAATISLSGSNEAVTAFLTCANIGPPGNKGGSNPFQNTRTTSSN